MARTLHLIERRSRFCRLAPREAGRLAECGRGLLEVRPTSRRRIWQVTAAGVVGVFHTPDFRVVLSPKLPISPLLHVLDTPLAASPLEEGAVADGGGVIDWLSGLFARLLHGRLTAGLHRGYLEQDLRGPYLLGRLDVASQVRQAGTRLDLLHCHHDDFTCDLPCNRALKAVATWLAHSSLLAEHTRVLLTQARAAMQEISDAALNVVLSPMVDPPGYGPLLDLCRLLVAGRVPVANEGHDGPAVLVSLERLFERYVTCAARRVTSRDRAVEIEAQETLSPAMSDSGPELVIRPDVILRCGSECVVVDAKWKRLPATGLHSDDVYQVVSYATMVGAGHAVLVYPGGKRQTWEYTFPHTPVRLTLRRLRVAGTQERCTSDRHRLARELRAMLG